MTRPGVLALLGAFFLFGGCLTSSKAQYYIELGTELARDGLYEEAILNLKKAALASPNNPIVARNLGIIYVRQGEYKLAKDQFEKVTDYFQDDFSTYFYLGEAYRGLEKFSDAIFYYQRASELKDNDPRLLKSLTWSLYRIKFYSEALKKGKILYNLDRSDPHSGIILARILIKLKLLSKAEMVLSRVKSSDRLITAYVAGLLGTIFLDREDLETAKKHFRRSLFIKPFLASSLIGLGRILLAQGKPNTALVQLKRAQRANPKIDEVYLYLAKAYQEAGKSQEAGKYYRLFLKKIARDPEYLSQLPEIKRNIAKIDQRQ